MKKINDTNLDYFDAHLTELLANPLLKDKFILIAKGDKQGFYDTFENALNEAVKKFDPGTFIIQEIIAPDASINFLFSAIGA